MADRIDIHVTTSGTTRTPIGSLASLHTPMAYPWISTVTCDNQPVEGAFEELSDVEELARERPGEWVVQVCAPLWDATWKREGEDRWVCTEAGQGYA